jgi:hypothetical protein
VLLAPDQRSPQEEPQPDTRHQSRERIVNWTCGVSHLDEPPADIGVPPEVFARIGVPVPAGVFAGDGLVRFG